MGVETCSSSEMNLAMEEEEDIGGEAAAKPNNTRVKKLILLVINCIILCIGNTGSPLIMRLYFIHGGSRVWLVSWLETAAWPLILLPLAVSYMYRRRRNELGAAKTKMVLMKPFLLFASAGLGILTGMDNYIYAYGIGLLPVSTSSLIIATQLAFTAVFAFLLVKQRFTWYSVNSVFLLTVGAAVLGLHSGNDRPEGESNTQYMLGFGMTLGAAALYGLILPLVELTYKKAKQAITYTLVLEMQLVLCIFATAFCTVGMLINKDFQAITREAKEFEIGEVNYYWVLAWNAIILQCFFLGAVGVVFCASSLFSGVLIAVLLPVTEILAVFFFKEKFQAEKAISLILSFWGFISYFYGEMKTKNNKPNEDEDRNRPIIPATKLHEQSVPSGSGKETTTSFKIDM